MVKAMRMFALVAALAMAAFTPGEIFAQETTPAPVQGTTAALEDEDEQEGNLEDEQSPAGRAQAASVKQGGGAVFAMTNATTGNRIIRYSRASNGTRRGSAAHAPVGLAKALIRIPRGHCV